MRSKLLSNASVTQPGGRLFRTSLDEAFPAVYVVVEVLFGEVMPREALVSDGKGGRDEEVADDVGVFGHLVLAHHA